MDRRDFCRVALGCTVIGCAGGLAGCARLLEWSARDTGAARVATMTAGPPPSAEPTAPGVPTATPEPTPPALPDLAVYRGDDPAANTRAAVLALGGMERFVKPGARVVVKPNIITGRDPELATTTNPQAVAEVVRMALEAGAASVVVFDRPTGDPRTSYTVSGIQAAVEAAGGSMKTLSDRNFERFEIPAGQELTSWPLVTDVFEADTFINMPIGKTHGLAGLTLSMKNLMGIMGGARGEVHQRFHQKIVDLATLVQPHLVILDAYRIMIRNGPTGGKLEDVATTKTVVAGTNMPSVDAYGTTLFGMQPTDLEYLRNAGEQGVGVIDLAALLIQEGTA
ncbi:MAG: DUF362 domain-containing protein [Coriobacteriia bacterium]|nr:DUF362 domain-containing protein [Coriobacteriia bacterium]